MSDKPTFVIKKIKIKANAHHGGAWKVAYADFVTAMMAFFLLLWLLSIVSSQTLSGVADYFSANPSNGPSGSGGLLSGKTANIPGTATTPMRHNVMTQMKKAHQLEKQKVEKISHDNKPVSKGPITNLSEMSETIQNTIKSLPIHLQQLSPAVVTYKEEEGTAVRILADPKKPLFIDKTNQLTPAGIRIFKMIALYINKNPYMVDTIGCVAKDPDPTIQESNWQLAILRAGSVISFLKTQGAVPLTKLHAIKSEENTDKKMPCQVAIFFHKAGRKKTALDTIFSGTDAVSPPVL